jgi:uncharacterized protein (TIGR02246 family)
MRRIMSDEQAIRDLIDSWMRASATGDLAQLSQLMAEDVVFLLPGQQPLRGRDAFLDLMKTSLGRIRIDATSEVQEIRISDALAYCWNHLRVTVTPLPSGEPKRRSGFVLSILRKEANGNWVVARDANLLTPE